MVRMLCTSQRHNGVGEYSTEIYDHENEREKAVRRAKRAYQKRRNEARKKKGKK